MVNSNRVVINKNFLKKYLFENEEISKSLSRFIDNSIKARKDITTKENPCKITIRTFEDLIVVGDNSGGINGNLSGKDILRIGDYDGYEISGLGMKKSAFSLGNKLDIISNKKRNSRKFTVDFNSKDDELSFQEENIEFAESKVEGTNIFISDLRRKTKKEMVEENIIIYKLGRMYSKFIDKGEVIISVNGTEVKAKNIIAKKICTRKILNKYVVDLYKGDKKDISGIDLFINDYMIYDREKSKKEVKWNLLNEAKHTYTDCIVEVTYNGENPKFNEEKELLFTEVIKFIKENKIYFQSKNITIQYEMPIEAVEELKEYYNENTAKAIGIKAFNKLLEDYKNEQKLG
ncbi:histidine kinase-, DNA gyrase B-, and HSP90-like ATPase family protein [Clostridium baratii str. Sullivan]|uniref:Histidine kinase-, DNA gyrase B-, and HSP90-like ATPase family protein n=1 Tax=Clostridium baratii str. Sullivan TaxID=1415775 RepID=A0A0A7FSK3_9CLOT|nr:ATP-binding protein [Clostridium baratii]AIY82553.1 histidine kinase-, DNA gyrase B-, and HSP90-like ATPase family protein [Clostridium baratii str. Sullivan]